MMLNKIIATVTICLLVGCASSNSTENINVSSSPRVAETSVKNGESDLIKDTLIIPGKRVGPITGDTTRTELEKIFGESKLTDTTTLVAEGTVTLQITKVDLGERSLTVGWTDASRNKVESVFDFGSEWKTPEGIGVGTSFAKLREILGEFTLTGLDWDYGGFINFDDTKLSDYQGDLNLRIAAAPGAAEKFPQQYTQVVGDQQVSSTNPNWEPLDPRVYQMRVQFNLLKDLK